MSLSPAQLFRRLQMGKSKRTLLDAGIIDETGVHTKEGRNLLWSILFDQFEDKLVEVVEAQKAEAKKSDK